MALPGPRSTRHRRSPKHFGMCSGPSEISRGLKHMLEVKCRLKYSAELESRSALNIRLRSPSPVGSAQVCNRQGLQTQGLEQPFSSAFCTVGKPKCKIYSLWFS